MSLKAEPLSGAKLCLRLRLKPAGVGQTMQTYRASVPNKFRHKHRHLAEALRVFWDKAGKRETHLALLREFAGVKIKGPMWFTKPKYKAWRKVSAAGIIKAQHYACFVCVKPATSGHHIVQLQHGGTNVPCNIVPVCESCHADIHPWMPTDDAPDARPIWG